MFPRRSSASRFAMCPVCGSGFIVTASRVEAGKGWQTWNARCGQCHTWRTDVLSDRAARRFARHLKREAKRMTGLVRGTPYADPDRELRRLAATQPAPRR